MATRLENAFLFIVKVNKVLSHTAAKDRLVRLIQYLMKFLTFSLSLPIAASKARAMELLLIDARKVFRFFRFMESFVKMQKLFTSLQRTSCIKSARNGTLTEQDHQVPLQLCQLIKQSSLFAFFITDHALLLSKLSITNHDPIFLRQVFGGVWLMSCLSGVGADVIRLKNLYGVCVAHEDKESPFYLIDTETDTDIADIPVHAPYPLDHHMSSFSDSINNNKNNNVSSAEDQDSLLNENIQLAKLENSMDLILNGLNAFIALNLTKKDMPFHRGVVGACGIITSSIQLWQISRNHLHCLSCNGSGSGSGRDLEERLEVPCADDGIIEGRRRGDMR